MCGIRIGCVVSRNKEVINTILKFAQARLSPPSFGQIAAEAALLSCSSAHDTWPQNAAAHGLLVTVARSGGMWRMWH